MVEAPKISQQKLQKKVECLHHKFYINLGYLVEYNILVDFLHSICTETENHMHIFLSRPSSYGSNPVS